MDSVNIETQQGHLIKANVSFVRAPMVGDWITAGNQWNQVVGVLHRWVNNAPVLVIRIAPQAQPHLLENMPAPDDYVPFP